MRRLWVFPIVLATLVASALPALAEITPADVEEARAQIRETASRLEDMVAAYDAALVEEAELRDQLDGLVVSLAARERDLVLARRAARERAAAMYMTAGSDNGATALVSNEEMGSYPARYAYLASVTQTDLDVVNRLDATRRDFDRQKLIVDQAIDDQEELRQEADGLVDGIYSELEIANNRYQEVRAAYEQQEEERRLREFLATSTTTTTTVPPVATIPVSAPPSTTATTVAVTTTPAPPTTVVGGTTTTTATGDTTATTSATTTTTAPSPPPSGRVCPVDGAVAFRDSWGEPRSGGRTHKGTDMMAARWTPLVAIEAGYIYQVSWHSAGGLGIYVKGESGAMWYYAHDEAVASGISVGTAVVAGQLIGYVGSSGNASTPHLHFGYQPNADWIYANPYPIVDALCR